MQKVDQPDHRSINVAWRLNADSQGTKHALIKNAQHAVNTRPNMGLLMSVALILGYFWNGVSFAALPVTPDRWLPLKDEIYSLEQMTNDPVIFKQACEKTLATLAPCRQKNCVRLVPIPVIFDCAQKIHDISPKAPYSFQWAEIRQMTLHAAALRLAGELDTTKDKGKLSEQFWNMFRICAKSLAEIQQDFESAGGEKAAQLIMNNVTIVPAPKIDQTTQKKIDELKDKQGFANALAPEIPSLQSLLKVQCINAFPKVPVSKLGDSLKAKGFSAEEIKALLGGK